MAMSCPQPAVTACFLFNATATTEIYTLSLHDALPILLDQVAGEHHLRIRHPGHDVARGMPGAKLHQPHLGRHRGLGRSEEHTSELQSPYDLVCRLLLEKKKETPANVTHQRPRKRSERD